MEQRGARSNQKAARPAIKESRQRYYERHRARINARHLAYYHANKDKRREYERKNRAALNALSRKSYAQRKARDPIKVSEQNRARRLRTVYKESWRLKHRYGLTIEQRDALFAENGGMCMSCSTRPSTHIDHCHVSSEIRGALCHRCNAGIGLLGDTLEAVQNAVSYLERFKNG